MKRLAILAGGTALALTSVLVVAQDAPESLLPPGFERPAAKAAPPPSKGPSGPTSTSSPVVQAIPGGSGGGNTPRGSASQAARPGLPSGVRIPSLQQLEAMTPDQLDDLFGLKPKSDIPPAARRALKKIGILAEWEGGFPSGSLALQPAALVRAALEGNEGRLVSRWGHILLRRALASRLDAPNGIAPADFAAQRAALLVRMGEGEAARGVVQDIDAGNFTPALTRAAIDAYVFTGDITGICPAVAVQGGSRKDAEWQVLRAICASFEGDGNSGMVQLDRIKRGKVWPAIDMLLAQKYAGAAGKARRAVKIEWNGVNELTPWRYALTLAVGLEPPAALFNKGGFRYRLAAATAPMATLAARAKGADVAAGQGVLSAQAMVDLYSQVYSLEGRDGDLAARADLLRNAYLAPDANDRLAAIKALWDEAKTPQERYSRQVLTAYAAARLPAAGGSDAPDLISSMLSAGLDANALRWAAEADVGSEAWALLALAAPTRETPVAGNALESFYSGDDSDAARKSGFLLAGLAGLGRIDDQAMGDFSAKIEVDLTRSTRWTQAISAAADVNNQALVAMLAGLGMQGDSWAKMTPLHLYHIVSALDRVGLSAEARMIAAEAVARG
jgi:hypothetical protein